MEVLDRRQRPLASLRISVTDRCNLRCAYCMPEESYAWLARGDLLSFEELGRVVGAFTRLGVSRVRLTGGEPLLRRDLERLIAILAAEPALEDLALTTNGLLLAEQARRLADAGLRRLSVSLDTLRPERFRELARRDGLEDVLAGLEAARAAGFRGTKLDTVVLRGVNEDELAAIVAFARERELEPRFIEYMDVGGATRWKAGAVVPAREIRALLERELGPAQPFGERGSAPAERFLLPDGTVFGLIGSTTQPFCGACDRARLTADGRFFTCLYAPRGLDLRAPLRAGASAEQLAELVRARWSVRDDRGAEERLALRSARGPLAELDALRADPHLEMHTRGG